jgi:predicted RNase H-like HicB family nuclease/uncharacterized damage-inducible protein DinB
MTLYHLYVESGPKHKKTMVHVCDLLACVAIGPTTEKALEKTPDAIRAYLHFLQRHGADVVGPQDIQLQIAQHITEGDWLGHGSPYVVFQIDLEPLAREELEEYIQHLHWSRSELVSLIDALSDEQLAEEARKGRPMRAILEHIFGAEYSYVRNLGKLEGVSGPGSVEHLHKDELLARMERMRTAELGKLRSFSPQELSEVVTRGKQVLTVRRMVRRMLEHEWEHLMELKERLAAWGRDL